jgi:hypothetical protein
MLTQWGEESKDEKRRWSIGSRVTVEVAQLKFKFGLIFIQI